MATVAQLVRASDCGPEGRGFESHQSPQFDKKRSNWVFTENKAYSSTFNSYIIQEEKC